MITLEKTIFKDLYESVDGLYSYTFYSRYKIEPIELAKFISKYIERGYIIYESDKVRITDNGRNAFHRMHFTPGKGKLANIPNEYVIEKLPVNSFYLPDVKFVSQEIL